ncbi:MAG: TRAP transporter large permease [Flavobacteriaceae bacterium]
MSGMTAGLVGMAIMLVLMAGGMPVAIAMTLVGFVGTAFIYDWNWTAAIGIMGIEPYNRVSEFLFTTIPLFLLMGQFAHYSGISQEMYDTARKWMGHWRGGLGVATVGACGGFAAASGSSIATGAAMGTITIPEMRKHGYSAKIATGVVAAGGTLGILIPPSVGMIIYALIADQSIGRLFIAGIVPGIMLTIMFMLTVVIWAFIDPAAAPRSEKYSWSERLRSTSGVLGITILFIIVMGGIYTGIFTPTEAAAIGAVGSYLMVVVKKRSLCLPAVFSALIEAAQTTCMIFFIIIGSHILNVFLAATQTPAQLSSFVGGLDLNAYLILAVIIVIYLILGCFLDTLAMIVLTVPIFFPILINLGFDPIWFGVIVIIVMEMALITPPVGMCIFVIKGVARDVPLSTIFGGVWPFLIAQILAIVVLTAFPQLVLWLPAQMLD